MSNQHNDKDFLHYGNPTAQQKQVLESKTILDSIFSNFENHNYPANTSDTTRIELNDIVEMVNIMRDKKNAEILENYILFDKNVAQGIINIFLEYGIDVSELVVNIQDEIIPLVTRLKFFYNRPRPFQLAYAYQLKLFPFESKSSSSPSYPSMTTLLSRVMLKTISAKYNEQTDLCEKMIKIIEYSRVYLGQNYQSDNDFAIEIADTILLNQKFCTKYDV